jgi:SsrA-binding protein
MNKTVNILNKRAKFDYEIIDKYTAGIVLTGTEIKSIRLGKAGITESFCEFHNQELFVINSNIEEYHFGNQFNHKPKELKGLFKDAQNKGLTIIPLRLFTNEKGIAKLDIALCRGKKNYDKRETIKDRDNKRDLDRIKKAYK